MATIRPFLFDTSFDPSEPAAPEPELAPAEPEPEPEPTFSLAELAAAEQAAATAAAGQARAEALAEAERTVARRQMEAMESLANGVAQLVATVEARNATLTEEAVRVGLAVAARLLPDFTRRHGLAEIEALIGRCMAEMVEAPRIAVRVHDSLRETIAEAAASEADRTGFAGRVVVLGDDALRPGDARVDWGDGGAERDLARLWADVDRVASRTLGIDGAVPPSIISDPNRAGLSEDAEDDAPPPARLASAF